MPEQIQALENKVKQLEDLVNILIRKDRYYFRKNLDLDNVNIISRATTGTKIGTATTEKLGFWGATPVVKDTFHFNGTIGGTWDSVAQATLSNLQRVLISYGVISS